MTLWRYAVLAEHDCRCFICGHPYIDELECHHVVKRSHRVLRWDWRNGVPLCAEHHRWAHTGQGRRDIEDRLGPVRRDYLYRRERVTIKDFLQLENISRNEFEQRIAEDLKNKARLEKVVE